NWLDDNNFSVPPVYSPERECNNGDPHPILELNVNDGDIEPNPTLAIIGTANATGGFKSWRLEFGLGNDPSNWTTLAQGNQSVKNDLIFNWDMSNLPSGTITLHLYVAGTDGYAEKFVHFTLAIAPPPPPPATITPFPSPTDTPVVIIPTDIPTDTPFPSETPTETPTP